MVRTTKKKHSMSPMNFVRGLAWFGQRPSGAGRVTTMARGITVWITRDTIVKRGSKSIVVPNPPAPESFLPSVRAGEETNP